MDPRNPFRFVLYVSNPLTKQCVQLPDAADTCYPHVEVGFATRCGDHAEALLTYKVVIFHTDSWHPKGRVEIFSSDTGSWVAWNVSWSQVFYKKETQDTCFSYKGILHWLDIVEGTIITYNPYESPDQFGRIRLPEGKYSLLDYDEMKNPNTEIGGLFRCKNHERKLWCLARKYCLSSGRKKNQNKSVIYSGEEEVLKYCEVCKCEGVDRLMVWQLVDYDNGKWCLEGEYSVPSLLYDCKRLIFALYPWNRDVICHPDLSSKTITVINPRAGTTKLADLFYDDEGVLTLHYKNRFLPAEMCRPWSSPYFMFNLAVVGPHVSKS